MDITNSEMLKQEWTAFTNAPFIMLAGMMVVGMVAWWFRGKLYDAQIVGLKEQMVAIEQQRVAIEQRMKFFTEGFDRAKNDFVNLEKQFQDYKAAVAAKGRDASPEKVDAAIVKVTDDYIVTKADVERAIKEIEARPPVGEMR